MFLGSRLVGSDLRAWHRSWTDYGPGSNPSVCATHAEQASPTCPAFLNLSRNRYPKKILDNQYTDTITWSVLPRRLTPTSRPPAKLNPLPSHSCKLFCTLKEVNSHQISNFQTLFAKHPGWGVHPRHPISFVPAVECATQRLYPLRPQQVAHTSRRHGGVPSFRSLLARPTLPSRLKSRASSHLQPLWPLFAVFFSLPFFIFNSLQPLFPKHPGGGVPLGA